MRKPCLVALLLVVATTAASCGGDDAGGGASCGFSACGGDLVGRWELTAACVQAGPEAPEPECEGMFRGLKVTGSGTVEFRDDGQLDAAYSVTWSSQVVVTRECADALGWGEPSEASCGLLEPLLELATAVDSASCSFANDTCDCSVVATGALDGQYPYDTTSSTYTVLGSTTEYCVRGSSLSVLVEDDDGSRTALTLARR